MTPEQCRAQKWPHNHRCRYTSGFYCEDCETFYDKDSEDWQRYELPGIIWDSLHNLGADCIAMDVPIPGRLRELMDHVQAARDIDSPMVRSFVLNKAMAFLGCAGIEDPEKNTILTLNNPNAPRRN